MKSFIYLLLSILLFSCGKFSDGGGSVWQQGLWVVPWLTGLGGTWFMYLAYKASKSNSTTQTKDGRIIDNTGNVPIYKLGKFYFACALYLATIIIVIMVNADK